MIPASETSSTTSSPTHDQVLSDRNRDIDGGIDLFEIYRRLSRGFAQAAGFAVLGLAIGLTVFLISSPFTSSTTSMRVTFAFNGYAKGEYPDHSKFQPDDIRAPDVIFDALKRQGLDTTDDFQGRIRAALTIEGLIPANVIKERDRLRAAGQTIAPFLPDEYLVTLTLPRKDPISNRQRELLLNEIVSTYEEKFQRTYTEVPSAFGNAFESLRSADFSEYELVFSDEIQNLQAFLHQELDQAKTFRSPTTNLSFNDLITQTELFSQIHLYETLGIIRQSGLSRNRNIALLKMNYYLRTLGDREQKAIEDEKVVVDLLTKSQERSQNYVLGIKSQASVQRAEGPILDQGLIDSLLVNDSSNFLVHQALDAGLKVKSLQAAKTQLIERIKDMEQYLNRSPEDQTALYAQVQKSLAVLENSYDLLIQNIRKTQADFARQQFSDAIRISMQPITGRIYKPLLVAGGIGAFIGLALGVGLSLLEIYISASHKER